jgi:Cu(I)/Ag(I) efflux system protein CusF
MKKSIVTLLVCGALAFGADPAAAQQQDHSAHHATGASKAADMVDGEVRKVDKEAKKITLKHGQIKNLDMPPMTMVFQVTDPAMLEKVRAGDKVRFTVEKVDGAYTVTALEAAK